MKSTTHGLGSENLKEESGKRVEEKIESFFRNAEAGFQESLHTLERLSEHATDLLCNRPNVLLASMTIAGFAIGTMVRQSATNREDARSLLTGDPFALFLSSVLAGVILGRKIVPNFTGKQPGSQDEGG